MTEHMGLTINEALDKLDALIAAHPEIADVTRGVDAETTREYLALERRLSGLSHADARVAFDRGYGVRRATGWCVLP